MDTRYSTNIAGLFDTTSVNNVVSLLCGTNDYSAGTTDLSAYTSILSWVSKAKATGYTVLIFTPISRFGTDNGHGQTGDQYEQALSARIIGGAVANGYTVIDLNGDVNIGCTGCYANTTYFNPDEIHLTQTGYNIIGSYYLSALNALGIN